VLASDDLTLVSPALRLTGAGKVFLPSRLIDYRVKPAIIADATAATDNALAVPVHITGPWAKPNLSLDLGEIAKNPSAAVNAVKQALAKVKGGEKVQEAVTNLANSKEGKAIGDLLGGLLGKKDAGTALGLNGAPAQ
jgi:AsmA protein